MPYATNLNQMDLRDAHESDHGGRFQIVATGPLAIPWANTLRRSIIEGRVPLLRLKTAILRNTSKRCKDEAISVRVEQMALRLRAEALAPEDVGPDATPALLHVINTDAETRFVTTADFATPGPSWFLHEFLVAELDAGEELSLEVRPYVWAGKTVDRVGFSMIPDPDLLEAATAEHPEKETDWFKRDVAPRHFNPTAPSLLFWVEDPAGPITARTHANMNLTRLAAVFTEVLDGLTPVLEAPGVATETAAAATPTEALWAISHPTETWTTATPIVRILQDLCKFATTFATPDRPGWKIRFSAPAGADPAPILAALRARLADLFSRTI